MKRGIFIIFTLILIILSLSVYSQIFVSDLVKEGDIAVYQKDDKAYFLKVLIVDPFNGMVIFELNGERSSVLKEKDEHRFTDNSVVFVSHIFGDSPEGGDLVEFYFSGSGKAMVEFSSDILESKKNKEIDKDDMCYDDCDDENPCTEDLCLRNQCVYDSIGSCILGNSCLNISERKNDKVCTNSGLITLKKNGDPCTSGIECESKVCESVCVDFGESTPSNDAVIIQQQIGQKKGMFSRFFGWLKNIFT